MSYIELKCILDIETGDLYPTRARLKTCTACRQKHLTNCSAEATTAVCKRNLIQLKQSSFSSDILSLKMSISNATKNEIYRFSRCNMPSESDADASRCIDAAEDAAARCDFAKAERLLLKAVRLCPLVDVQNLLREVRAKMKESEASGPSNGRRAAVYAQSLPNDSGDADAADTCLQKAQAALKTGKLEAAERWAARALRLRSQQDVVADLLLRVEEAKRLRALQPSPAQLDAITRVMAATNDYERLGELLSVL